ncbi:hypothetical protein BS47DRAFT_1340741 [Hydnum rufescens UP504]|uniref:BRCA2 OB1 domain-containing protein n=1 Tax=Hydnum rufescens UP504 TaxID=1448309 RepID=A0A9P6E030_9AGAM|nr:hypothetical protein BS47DRAFT_1340741 [Hydnum rufescens UP504]
MDGNIYQTSPLNPDRAGVPSPGFSTPIRRSTMTTSTSGPSRSSTTIPGTPLAFSTPVSFLKPGVGNHHHPVKTVQKGFITPYKPGFRPGENGRTNMDVLYRPVPKVAPPPASARSIKDKGKQRAGPLLPNACFDLTPSANRLGLRESGVVPCVLDLEGLSENGIPPELPQITPANAIYHVFHAPDARAGEPLILGVAAALPYLRQRGCSLATQEWVDNHWSLVLWKRASIICCKPTLLKELWSFESTCKDLMYRYERDLNRTQRPVVRLIQERDASSSRPMVLCVSAIHWSEEVVTDAGSVPSHPKLELTDGWYRIRATVDAALARATRKKKIRLGTKIFMSGIRLDAPGEPKEVLKAYSSSSLTLCGNSTTLARWDARLGVSQPQAPITASLRSLNPDGGVVMLLDIVVEKLFPVGYLETAAEGKRLIPTNAAEEQDARTKWEETRQVEEAKIKSELKSRWFALEGIAERAERVANGWMPGPEDEEPNSLDDLYDDLESGWLAFYIRKRLEEQRATAGEYIENELKSILPPRDVRNFRVIRVKDARVWRRPALRTAQITVWDVLALGEGFLTEGRRYLVSNLMPSQASSWPALKEEGEVFLTTRRDSRWRRLEMS